MKKEDYRAIFDMDGTLYQFDKGEGKEFTSSRFYGDLKNNVYGFFMARRGISREIAISEYERIKAKYNGEISIGVETEYEIDRYEYFRETWGTLNPMDYIDANENLPEVFNALRGKIALLTTAPRIWALNVLAYLQVKDVFDTAIYTGEPNLRKPNPLIFQKIADNFGAIPSLVFSIGDQEISDIIPAKTIGMKTIKIGNGETQADYQIDNVLLAINLLRKEGFL